MDPSKKGKKNKHIMSAVYFGKLVLYTPELSAAACYACAWFYSIKYSRNAQFIREKNTWCIISRLTKMKKKFSTYRNVFSFISFKISTKKQKQNNYPSTLNNMLLDIYVMNCLKVIHLQAKYIIMYNYFVTACWIS